MSNNYVIDKTVKFIGMCKANLNEQPLVDLKAEFFKVSCMNP